MGSVLRLPSERQHRSLAARAPFALVVIAALVGACAPPCEQVCRKARECDLSPRLAQDECVEACDRQRTYFDVEEDDEGKKAFIQERECIVSSTCEEIQDGACYDPYLYPF